MLLLSRLSKATASRSCCFEQVGRDLGVDYGPYATRDVWSGERTCDERLGYVPSSNTYVCGGLLLLPTAYRYENMLDI